MRPLLSTFIASTLLVCPCKADGWNEVQSAVLACADVDGDGARDLLVASRDRKQRERVWLVSGRTGALLRTFLGRANGDGFGRSLALVGDLDRDGIEDVLIGARGVSSKAIQRIQHVDRDAMYGTIVSPARGTTLIEIEGPNRVLAARDDDGDGVLDLVRAAGDATKHMRIGNQLGPSGLEPLHIQLETSSGYDFASLCDALARTGDLDGDGRTDFVLALLGARFAPKGPRRHYVIAASGADGSVLWSNEHAHDDGWMATRLVPTSDVDGDGRRDLLFGAEDRWVRTLSGRDGKLLSENLGRSHVVYAYASSLDVIGDLDGDCVDDWICGANELPREFFDFGRVFVASGATGKTIREVVHSEQLGFDACGLGDVDRDGVPDFAISCERQALGGADDGEAAIEVLSGANDARLWKRGHCEIRASEPRSPK